MKLLPVSGAATNHAGLTVVELLMVIGIIAVIFAAGVPVGLNFYLDYQLDSEYNLLASLLRSARNLSMTNYNEADHGVYIGSGGIVVFQGTTYATRTASKDKTYPRNSVITIAGATEVDFTALSGASASTTITISDNRNKSWTVYVNPEGLIYE